MAQGWELSSPHSPGTNPVPADAGSGFATLRMRSEYSWCQNRSWHGMESDCTQVLWMGSPPNPQISLPQVDLL